MVGKCSACNLHIPIFFPASLSSFSQFSELLHRAKADKGIEGASVAGGLANCI